MFHGSMVAIVTPMYPDGNIDYRNFGRLIDWHLDSGTDAIVVAGTTGESGALSAVEKRELIAYTVERVNQRVPVIAGTSAVSTEHTIALTHMAMEVGVDASLLMTSPYIKPTQEGLFRHYEAIAKAVALPHIVYNVPARTACDILPETLARLACIPNIVGVKEASGDLDRVAAIQSLSDGRIDIYSGEDALTLAMMKNGAKGVISVTANVAPKAMHDLCAAALAGDFTLAERINEQLSPIHETLFVQSNPIPVKWLLYKMDKILNSLRMPLLPLESEYRESVENLIANL